MAAASPGDTLRFMRPLGLCLACLLSVACATPAPTSTRPAPQGGSHEDGAVFAEPGYTKPREKDRGCVGRRIKLPPGATYSGLVTVKFLVGSDGSIGRVERLTPLSDGSAPEGTVKRFDERLEGAIRSCDFEPGLDPKGIPRDIWLILPFVFVRP
jgi:outer membrane biosynthesis protein TonB